MAELKRFEDRYFVFQSSNAFHGLNAVAELKPTMGLAYTKEQLVAFHGLNAVAELKRRG